MRSPRGPRRVVGIVLAALACGSASSAITLPEPLAVEIPVEGQTTISAEEPPLSDLLAGATSTNGPVDHDRHGVDFPIGATLVTWSDGIDEASAWVYVYPFGQTPAGSTDYERATSGNGGTNVVRDRWGRIHVAWLDSGRGDDRVMYRRAVQDPDSGLLTWQTDAVRVSEDANDVYNSMVGVAASDDWVHLVWYGGGDRTYYRRLHVPDDVWDPIRNTGARGSLSNNGPDVAVRGNDEIHVVTPANSSGGGQYAISTDGGATWSVETIPRPPTGLRMKAPSVAVDRHGNAHVVFPWQVRDVSGQRYWELRYVRRTAAGAWVDAQYALGQFPEWSDPLADADPSNDGWDILADWLDVAVGEDDHVHVTWHGTANSHRYAQDEAFYVRRPATGPGTWSATWDPFVSLWPLADGLSFAPSVLADAASGLAIAVTFHDVNGAEDYDSNFKFLPDGAWDGAAALDLTTMAADGHGLTTWFPCVAPRWYAHGNGRVWLDVLATDWPAEPGSDMLLVHQRREITGQVAVDPVLAVERDRLDWSARLGATAYDVVRGDVEVLRAGGGDFSAATDACLAADLAATTLAYADDPAPGSGDWFLVRARGAGEVFTYDWSHPSQVAPRDAGIAASPVACP